MFMGDNGANWKKAVNLLNSKGIENRRPHVE